MAGSRIFDIRNRKAVNELLHVSNVTIINMRKASIPGINISRRRICPNNVCLHEVIDKTKLR
jgi:hypothetical protein